MTGSCCGSAPIIAAWVRSCDTAAPSVGAQGQGAETSLLVRAALARSLSTCQKKVDVPQGNVSFHFDFMSTHKMLIIPVYLLVLKKPAVKLNL